ncbi:hypothetical protein CPC08DRAFT_794257 [Agrocybe pediades]|nr:hypothetical protein CPC08DRAFT_794257 [Agrocybe pediades]
MLEPNVLVRVRLVLLYSDRSHWLVLASNFDPPSYKQYCHVSGRMPSPVAGRAGAGQLWQAQEHITDNINAPTVCILFFSMFIRCMGEVGAVVDASMLFEYTRETAVCQPVHYTAIFAEHRTMNGTGPDAVDGYCVTRQDGYGWLENFMGHPWVFGC